ncbi:MAG: tyrosine-type recombinase/integrase [Clostridia bacterium]|nr:tyrosine-type recombinase/integrase [Clostridia bacterium]
MATTQPIRNREDLKRLAEYFLNKGEKRNYVLVVLASSTALRIGDLLKLKWTDVYDEKTNMVKTHIVLSEQKTGKPKAIAINEAATSALNRYYQSRSGDYIFDNGRGEQKPIGRQQAWRIITAASEKIGLKGQISCHSLRKTWGYHAWSCFRVSPVVIMQIYNHSSFEITKRYLGITQDEMDRAYRSVELF